jgi:hypothetical protein
LIGAFRDFNRHAAGFDEVVAKIPRGTQVLTMILHPMGDASVNVSAFNQFPSYVQLRHGGYNFYNFAEGFPLRYRMWDYFLTFREGWRFSPMKQPLADGKVRLIAENGVWRLYEKVER